MERSQEVTRRKGGMDKSFRFLIFFPSELSQSKRFFVLLLLRILDYLQPIQGFITSNIHEMELVSQFPFEISYHFDQIFWIILSQWHVKGGLWQKLNCRFLSTSERLMVSFSEQFIAFFSIKWDDILPPTLTFSPTLTKLHVGNRSTTRLLICIISCIHSPMNSRLGEVGSDRSTMTPLSHRYRWRDLSLHTKNEERQWYANNTILHPLHYEITLIRSVRAITLMASQVKMMGVLKELRLLGGLLRSKTTWINHIEKFKHILWTQWILPCRFPPV